MDKKLFTNLKNQLINNNILPDKSKINVHPISGGNINLAYKLTCDTGKTFFLKTNTVGKLPMFLEEKIGLAEIKSSNTLKTPSVITINKIDNFSYLLMEYLIMQKNNESLLAKNLAAMHQTSADQFGFSKNNSIGTTIQDNAYSDNWLDFWIYRRLLPQLTLAKTNNADKELFHTADKFLTKLSEIIPKQPKASLLHGDLWGGNWSSVADEPVVFDPAVYYGDRETDLAMTELFGGFSKIFYQNYQDYYPIESGFDERKHIYNLYHILNHFNLFGGSYAIQAQTLMAKFL